MKSNPDTEIIAKNLCTALGMEQLPAISAGAPRSPPHALPGTGDPYGLIQGHTTDPNPSPNPSLNP